MGVYTNISFLNGNDKDYLAAKNGTEEEKEEWEYDAGGSVEDIPGAVMECDPKIIHETEDEYGGWVIEIADIPKEATHIYIHRG